MQPMPNSLFLTVNSNDSLLSLSMQVQSDVVAPKFSSVASWLKKPKLAELESDR